MYTYVQKNLYFTPVKPFMNRTKCIIVEDSPQDMELLKHYVTNEPSLELTHTFANGIEALSLLKLLRPPLLFMDIDMPVMNGINLFKNLDYNPLCIFVTAHSEYALDSYEVQAFDFILKPVTAKRFSQTINRLNEYLLLRERADLYDTAFEKESITIKEGTTNHKVPLNDILYIEALKDYSKVVTQKKKYITLSKLKHFMDKLPPEDFLRIHRSYAIAKNKITTYNREEVTIDKEVLPIGKTYRQEARMALDN
jgi:DNA-binding LytR/AlgR family response regulator